MVRDGHPPEFNVIHHIKKPQRTAGGCEIKDIITKIEQKPRIDLINQHLPKIKRAAFLLLLWGAAACADPVEPPPIIREAAPPAAEQDLQMLNQIEPPPRDLADLARRYKGVEPAAPPRPVERNPGTRELFWIKDQEGLNSRQAAAVLAYRSDRLNLWIEDGVSLDENRLRMAAAVLEEEILPTTRRLFGEFQQPGLDGDPRLHLLHAADLGGRTIGYFSAADAYPPAVNPLSNGRNLLYLNLNHVQVGEPAYYRVVAHEFQHMIHWHLDANETTWINEGFSELAAAAGGLGDSDHLPDFWQDPDISLTDFDYAGRDYGAAYLFASYLEARFGADFIRRLAADPRNGREAIDALLAAEGQAGDFDGLFADWVVANLAAGRGYRAGTPDIDGVYKRVEFPGSIRTTRLRAGSPAAAGVAPYAADYWEVAGRAPQTVVFTGTRQIPLLATRPFSGERFWTTVPADSSAMHLTRELDLREVTAATLRFQTWYEIELGWDYGYISVSADGGRSWQTLETTATNGANPHGNNLGRGLTGTSGSLEEPRWIEQTADLSAYGGSGGLLLRFEYVTDDARHGQGWALDDIAVPEIGFFDDAEGPDPGWEAAGFFRHGNRFPQRFLVQQILIDRDGRIDITRLPVDADGTGRWTIPLDDRFDRAVIAVSAVTPAVRQPAGYQIGLEGR